MKTLEEAFRENLKRLRCERTQAEIAEIAKIPLRSYQHAESGIIPQGDNRRAIAGALGVSETALFLDQDLKEALVAKLALLERIAGAALDHDEAKALLAQVEAFLARLEGQAESAAAADLGEDGGEEPGGELGDLK